MAGASIEETLELWASSFRAVKARMRPLFLQERMAASAGLFLEGLLGGERRKTGWSRAEAAGDPGPWRQQAILGRSQWDADALRDVVRDSALETLADADAVLVIDETGFLKQGKASCGVGRQYTGSAGKITNCQVGVFAAYASRHGHAFVDRALYLPKAWTDDPARLAAAHVPDEVRFATKPKLAVAMIERAIAAEMPFAWVAADTVYGTGDVEMALRRAGKGYVLGANANHPFRSWRKDLSVSGTAEAIARELPDTAWTRLSAGEGTKGARLHDWHHLPLADLDASEFDGPPGPWTRGLLVRRHVADGSMAFFSTWCPLGTSLETLVAVEGRRWAIEDAFETAKNELGLDHNETRSWHGWHRHVSLVMTAFAMLAAIRHHANATSAVTPPPPKRSAKAFTRETAWHRLPYHVHKETGRSTITREEPCDYRDNNFERYYPVKTADGANEATYVRYKTLAEADSEHITFIGRCGTYRYLDMDQVINQSLLGAERWLRARDLAPIAA